MTLVKDNLRVAFPNSISISREDCEELRTKLVALQDEDVKLLLAPVLIDLLDAYCEEKSSPLWTDIVVLFLGGAAPAALEEFGNIAFDTQQLEEFAEKQKTSLARQFESFTSEQAMAIRDWLETVQNWPGIRSQDAAFQNALTYWRRKCK